MTKLIDIYCERMDWSFFAEPLNLWSNLFFVLAGVLLVYHARSQITAHHNIIKGYGITVALVGGGSFAFHGFATQWALLLDVLGIILCVFYALLVLTRLTLKLSWRHTALIFIFMFASTALFMNIIPSPWVNGSEDYFGILITLGVISFLDYRRCCGFSLSIATGLFALSLVFRSIDMAVCPHLAIGTHYFWHTFNAIVLYIVGKRFFVPPSTTNTSTP